jgi:hypothetical protein
VNDLRRRRVATLATLSLLFACMVPAGPAFAGSSVYYSTAAPLPIGFATASPIGNHNGNNMLNCSSGNWSKTVSLQTTGGSYIRILTSGNCPSYSFPTENSTRAACQANVSSGNYYANCKRYWP